LEIRVAVGDALVAERDVVPGDAISVSHMWEKANKDGTPDRRFSRNNKIPVLRYGCLSFAFSHGDARTYLFSNREAAHGFSVAFAAYQQVLREGGDPAEMPADGCPQACSVDPRPGDRQRFGRVRSSSTARRGSARIHCRDLHGSGTRACVLAKSTFGRPRDGDCRQGSTGACSSPTGTEHFSRRA
jgi:hypothetical protein